jgi:hypothetical protein
MGILDRFRRRDHGSDTTSPPASSDTAVAFVRGGSDDLEVVGESHYQQDLWLLSRATFGDAVRTEIVAVLVPEPSNPYDENAISVQIEGHVVGHLARPVAQAYLPGLRKLMDSLGGYVALKGVIVGGGQRGNGTGFLGVWLEHDPHDFGLSVQRDGTLTEATMRTGFSEAWLTDVADDSYDLSWFNELPEGDRPAIAKLRELLATDPDPIDRHFQFAELESRLYKSRDLYAEALDEYDDTCRRHDAEMEGICRAFLAKWEKIPLLDTYRQMAIRQQKKKDWTACAWWAQRGIALYGDNAARQDSVEDTSKAAPPGASKAGDTATLSDGCTENRSHA